MKKYTKRNKCSLPEFPPKYSILFFRHKKSSFCNRRVIQLNRYFHKLFQSFPKKVPYTYTLNDMCTPFKLNIGIIGKKGCGKSSFIEGIVRYLHSTAPTNFALPRRLDFSSEQRADTEVDFEDVPVLNNYASAGLLHTLHA